MTEQFTLTINSATILNWQSMSVQLSINNQDDLLFVNFGNPGGATSLQFTEAGTLFRSVTVQDSNGHYLFRGIVIKLKPERRIGKETLQLQAVGHFFQFTRQYATYNAIADPPTSHKWRYHVYQANESDDDKIGTTNELLTGMVSSVTNATTFKDNNKEWGVNEWQTAAPQKYGVVVIKNTKRIAESEVNNAASTTGTLANTYISNGDYYGLTKSGALVYTTCTFKTTLTSSHFTNFKVELVFDNKWTVFQSGKVEIYNFVTDAWDLLETVNYYGLKLKTYETLADGTALTVTNYLEGGEMKVKVTGGASAGFASEIWIYYIAIRLTITSYPSISQAIVSNDADEITITSTSDIDVYDYYIIGTLSSEVLKDVVGTYDLWQALTQTGITDGTHFVTKKWDYTPISEIIRYCCELEQYDYYIDNALDFHSRPSASATSTGLTFDEQNAKLQFTGDIIEADGSQAYTQVMVQWASGTETVNDATSQSRYGMAGAQWITYLYVDKAITSKDEAVLIANRLLTSFKTAKVLPCISSSSYVYIQKGHSVVVNQPSESISSVTYIVRQIVYSISQHGLINTLYILGLPGSQTHHYRTRGEDEVEAQKQLREVRQQIAATSGLTVVGTGGSSHASSHAPLGADPLLLDEDTLATDSDTKACTEGNVKAYADTKVAKSTLSAKGSLIYASAASTPADLTIGADNTYLKTNTDVPHWEALNIVEDTTPQLGGDLDLNGKNIDFPTTANISDCLDEDDMASNSATKLATQQSIKAYADTKAKIATGNYTGDGKDIATEGGKTITLTFTPKYVRIVDHSGGSVTNPVEVMAWDSMGGDAIIYYSNGSHYSRTNRLEFVANGFKVGDATSDSEPNTNGVVYDYVAMG